MLKYFYEKFNKTYHCSLCTGIQNIAYLNNFIQPFQKINMKGRATNVNKQTKLKLYIQFQLKSKTTFT
jgi:hypothetical protein